jgi:hypothetical protein
MLVHKSSRTCVTIVRSSKSRLDDFPTYRSAKAMVTYLGQNIDDSTAAISTNGGVVGKKRSKVEFFTSSSPMSSLKTLS